MKGKDEETDNKIRGTKTSLKDRGTRQKTLAYEGQESNQSASEKTHKGKQQENE